MIVNIRKDKLHRGVLRTLLLTDKIIFILAGVAIAGFDFVLTAIIVGKIYWLWYWGMVAISEVLFYLIAMLHIDNQPIYKVAYRAIFYFFSGKKLRGGKIGAYFHNFFIQDNLLFRKSSINLVFRITPHEITGISDAKRQLFFSHVRNSLNMLTTQLQIIVRKEFAKKEDLTGHFLFLAENIEKGDTNREAMLRNYRKDLLSFVENNKLLMWNFYGVFSAPADTGNTEDKVRGTGIVHDLFKRYLTSIQDTKVKAQQLENAEIISLAKKTLR